MRVPQMLQRGSTSINMTPMIDVVFLLIIFFLVSSHLAKQENHIQLDLPDAETGIEDSQRPGTLTINVLSDGSWQMAGRREDRGSLAVKLRQAAMGAEEPLRLRIRTDQSVRYEAVEPILQVAAQLGIGDLAFSVYESKARGPR